VTIFLGCGFAAKYREGGGNFSVPLQWMLGLRRLKLDAIWLELLPATKDRRADDACIRNFQRQAQQHGLSGRYCLLYQEPASTEHDLKSIRCIGLTKRQLLNRLAGPNALLNLSYSLHPPFLLQFERKVFCDLDPSEIQFWMTKLELGQSFHDEFWTIGLNVNARDCRLPKSKVKWRTFFPLVDTILHAPVPAPPSVPKFTTIGQWYWDGAIEVNGEYPDFSKKAAFEPYLDLPARFPSAKFELAINTGSDAVEKERLAKRGWQVVDPHHVARTPPIYRRYLANATAEFTAAKGADILWKSGWVSDRAAAFLASGRPVITEDTGARNYLPDKCGFLLMHNEAEAEKRIHEVLGNWQQLSRAARACAIEVFDARKNLRRILGL
jgi:hypothetical protein